MRWHGKRKVWFRREIKPCSAGTDAGRRDYSDGRKKYQFGGCKEKRGMAGLSMGSVQTTRTVCDHPDLFSEVGIFSGFLRDFIEGNPDRDVVDRKPYEQTHLKAMDNPAFNSYFHTFSAV